MLEVALWVALGVVELEAGHHAHCQLALFALICGRLPPLSLQFAADDTLRLCLLAADPRRHSRGSGARSAVRLEADAVEAAVVVFQLLRATGWQAQGCAHGGRHWSVTTST